MNHSERIEEVINSSNTSKERMFPILHKIGRIWENHKELQFCELVKLIVLDSKNDLEFTQKLDKFIDEQGIK
jgi:hypothetical protein